MIQREKNKKLLVLDSNQIQLSSNPCSCASPNLPSNDRWICHTVINLNSTEPANESEIVEGQPSAGKFISAY